MQYPAILVGMLLGCGAPPPAPVVDVTTEVPDCLRIVAVGDIGKDTPTREAVSRSIAATCAERGCDIGLLLGDNLYNRGMESASDPRMDATLLPLRSSAFPWFMVHGNHDYGHILNTQRTGWAREWAARTEGFEHPAPWYGIQAGPAELFALDTPWAFWRGDRAQRNWLTQQLHASRARWRIVFGHHPFRSEGQHGNAGAYEGWVRVPFSSGTQLEELFEATLCPSVDLYLAGHDHNLQLLDRCGTTLVVSGGGASGRPVVPRKNAPNFARGSSGYAWVELGDTAKVLFFDEDGRLLHESDAIEPRLVLY